MTRLRRLIVSAPFGNYLRFTCTTPTLGTFTMARRGGWSHRLWRILSTVRYRGDRWTNRLGLPNPGIAALAACPEDAILSLHGFDDGEWSALLGAAERLGAASVELNLSCPNVGRVSHVPPLGGFSGRVIAKLAPVGYMGMGRQLYEAGVRTFHLCNTLPSPTGGG